MRKMTLRLDALEVDSFEVSSLNRARNTVFGHDITALCGTGEDCPTSVEQGCASGSRVDETCHGYNTCFASCPGRYTCDEGVC